MVRMVFCGTALSDTVIYGTAFNVNNRGEKVVVFLEEGKIKVAADEEETYSSSRTRRGTPIQKYWLIQIPMLTDGKFLDYHQ